MNVKKMDALWRKHNVTGVEDTVRVATEGDLLVNHHMNVLMSAAVGLNEALDIRTGRLDDAMAKANHIDWTEHSVCVCIRMCVFRCCVHACLA